MMSELTGPTRIALVIHSLAAGGAERVAANLASYWCSIGRAVSVVTIESDARDVYELDPRVSRISLDLAAPSAGPINAALNNVERIRALRRILIAERPQLIISFMSRTNVVTAMASRGTDAIVLGSEHTYPPGWPLGAFWEWARRTGYAWMDSIVCVAQPIADWIGDHTRALRTDVIANPVVFPLPDGEPRLDPDVMLRSEERVLMSIGRMGHEKGFDILLSAFAKVASEMPQWRLVILGDGVLRPALERQAVDLGIAHRVLMPGRVGNVGRWLEKADLFILSSRQEGFPNVLIEAMAYGVASIAADCPTGPREIIRDSVDGVLVKTQDVASLADAMRRLAADATDRGMIADRGKEVRERFSLQRVAAQWDDVFRREQRRRAAPGTPGKPAASASDPRR
jgi:glycosyltransferase involved in cell wall biosynthesis